MSVCARKSEVFKEMGEFFAGKKEKNRIFSELFEKILTFAQNITILIYVVCKEEVTLTNRHLCKKPISDSQAVPQSFAIV
jgi:UDP-2,3-diacylglucosamine pyrophosphatase LpxH